MLAAEFHRTENLPVSPPSSTVTGLIGGARANVVPTLIAASGERASLRFLEFSQRTSATRSRDGPTAPAPSRRL
jgi:hypothetical protein